MPFCARRFRPTTSGGFESLNYDEAENNSIRAKYFLPDHERKKLKQRETAVQWIMVLTTGLLVGSIAYFSTWAVAQIVGWKFDALDDALQREAYVEGWLRLSGFVLLLALTAALLTKWAPEAAGSGIPHVKAYLNGNRLDGALRPRTLLAKAVGGVCCVAVGMPAGREGPMIHVGGAPPSIGDSYELVLLFHRLYLTHAST